MVVATDVLTEFRLLHGVLKVKYHWENICGKSYWPSENRKGVWNYLAVLAV